MNTRTVRFEAAGLTFEIRGVPSFITDSGREGVEGAVHDRGLHLVAAELARRGVVNGDAFRRMRKALGYKAADLGKLLGVRAETISRWETSAVPLERAPWALLAVMTLQRLGSPGDAEAVRVLEVVRDRDDLGPAGAVVLEYVEPKPELRGYRITEPMSR